jgi:hypothetical protein
LDNLPVTACPETLKSPHVDRLGKEPYRSVTHYESDSTWMGGLKSIGSVGIAVARAGIGTVFNFRD